DDRTEPSPAAVARRVGAPVPEPPTMVTLPDGRPLPVRAVSSTVNGVLDVPADIGEAGWWRGGSRIGDPFGSTLIAAHVDSAVQGLGPFASLLRVRPGDRVQLRSANLRQTFAITSLRLVPRDSFERHPRLLSSHGPRRLTLVTCAGPYDAGRGGYQNLAVVVSTPTSEPTRARS
ncbi:MAG TPA: class F sortase, partial [Nocardioides sp.]|nr:class F sortase [Nocardioides sp.]